MSVTITVLMAGSPTPAKLLTLCAFAIGSLGLSLGAAVDAIRRIRANPVDGQTPLLYTWWFPAVSVLVVSLGLGFLLPARGWESFSIPSSSNLPTLLVGDVVVADKTRAGRTLRQGDMVIFKSPKNPSIDYVKRVVGLPGDRVALRAGQLYINNVLSSRVVEGNYLAGDTGNTIMRKLYVETLPDGVRHDILKERDDGSPNNTPEYSVPPGHFFVLGDNRDDSMDSRFMDAIGFVPAENLVGRAALLLYSIDRQHPWWAFWALPFEIRWNRVFKPVV